MDYSDDYIALLDNMNARLENSPRVAFSLPEIPELSIMKEQTYGWYPAVRDVYTERRLGVPNTYDLEAMYNYRSSKYYTPPDPPSPRTTNAFRPSPTSPKRPTSSVSSKSGKDSSLSVRAKSAPIYNFKKVVKLQLPTPQQCWDEMRSPDMDMNDTMSSATLPTPTPDLRPPAPTPPHTTHVIVPTPPSSLTPTCKSPVHKPATPDSRKERIKSAVIRRESVKRPERSVKSAGPSRSPAEVKESERSDGRPFNPVLKSPVQYTDRMMTPDDSSRPTTADLYNQGLKEYGWRFEVHGDPFHLKRKTFSKRLPYYVTVDDPQIDPDGPKHKMENKETFFYNTIPRRPACYTIHKEWISETIHAKRMELQKREGIKHRWKNFSFVY